MPSAFITGITGQDGSYLSELLLEKGYRVIGMVSSQNDIGGQNISHIKDQLILEEGDLLDTLSIRNLIQKYQPTEIYNFGGVTFVPTSWHKPELVHNVNSLGTLRILEAIRDLSPTSRLFQASSAKIFGSTEVEKQTENLPFHPEEPYSVSKLAAHISVELFRNHFHIYGSCGILFNHESPRRGPEFVTRKITQGAVRIKQGLEKQLALGNLDAKQDWGWAPDYVYGMWLMLQQEKADDYILATGELHTVREVCEIAFTKVGLNYQDYVVTDPQFFRPLPDKNYYGDPAKAQSQLGWKRSVEFAEMIEKMVKEDLEEMTNSND